MKRHQLPQTLADLLLLASVWWFGSYIYEFVLAKGLKPLYSYIVVISMTGLYVVSQTNSRLKISALGDRWIRFLLVWLMAHIALGMLAYFESSKSEVAVQSLITLIEVSLVGASFVVLMANPRRNRQAAFIFVLLALFSTCMDIYDFIIPTFTNVPGRAAGLYVNPTTAGYMITMAMLGGIDAVRKRLQWPFIFICGIGVLITFTRSAWIMWGISAAWFGMHGKSATANKRLFATIASTVIGLGIVFALFAGDIGALVEQTPLARYLDPNTMARLGIGASSFSGDSTRQRLAVIQFSLKAISQSPLIGHGIGYTNEWAFPVGPHNMYLLFFIDGGVIGLVFYLSLMYILWRSSIGAGRVLSLQIALAGLFSHNLLQQPSVVMMMAYLVTQGAIQRRQQDVVAATRLKAAVA